LAEAGLKIGSINELTTRREVPEAVPVLIELLEDPNLQDDGVYHGVVRALREPAAKGIAVAPLIREYKRHVHEYNTLAAQIAVTIGYCALNEHADELIELMREKRFGWARSGLVDGLRNLGRDRLLRECRWMLTDPQLAGATLALIGKQKLTELVPEVKEIRDAVGVVDSSLRARAKKALDKLEKAKSRGSRA
jgi:hypothetical protein